MAVQTLHLINNDIGPQTLKSRATDVFRLQIYVYPKSGNAGGGTIALAINCTDSRGINAPTTVTAKSQAMPATGAWTQLDGFATVPTGYDTVDPVLTLTSVPTTDFVYVDDALVRESTYAQQVMSTVFGVGTLPASGAASIPPANVAPPLDGTSLLVDLQSLATTLFGGATSQQAGSFTAVLQNIADAMHQVTFGGSATNTDMDLPSLKAMFSAQPASTVVPPPNPLGTGGVTHGASSAGAVVTNSAGHTVIASFVHTPAAADNYVVVPVFYIAGGGTPSAYVTYGSQSGGLNVALGSLSGQVHITGNMYCQLFGGFITPGSGAQTVAMSAGLGQPSGYGHTIGGYSNSYSGVIRVGNVVISGLTTGTPTASVVDNSNDYVCQSFFDTGSSTLTLSAFTGGTQRYASGAVFSSADNEYMTMISGDAQGSASMTFGATTSNAFGTWAGLSCVLVGSPVTPIGSVFNAVQTSTGAISIATANAWTTFPANTWPTTAGWPNTADYTYNAATNTVTVLNAGTYLVSIGMLIYSLFTSQRCGLGIRKNGSLYRCGLVEIDNQSGAVCSRHIAVPVYCNAGDTITPVCYTTLATTVWQGEATGSQSYFTIGLMNRSLL